MKQLLLIAFIFNAFALGNLQAQLKYGITGAILPSYIIKKSGHLSETTDKTNGFSLGLIFDRKLSSTTSLQYKILFTQKGATGIKDNTAYTLKLNYIEVPMMLAVHFNKFQLNAGPYAAYGLTGRFHTGQDYIHNKSDVFNGYDFNRFDAGVTVGAGLSFTDNLILNLNYEHGLTNLYPSYTYNSEQSVIKGFNRNISLSLGYYFE